MMNATHYVEVTTLVERLEDEATDECSTLIEYVSGKSTQLYSEHYETRGQLPLIFW